jgi:ABC-type Fe3+/spermidine/putrescine transport system ATPase subunit
MPCSSASPRPVAVELRGVSKRFGGFEAVRNVSFRVARGETFSLVGPSGCGKTTVLNLIAGFLAADEGEVILAREGASPSASAEVGAVMVFQNYALFPHLTVFENVAFGLSVRRLPRATIAERVRAMLQFLGLSGREHAYPRQLSGGQQQRVALARALVVEPPVLLLDEPLSNLDARLRDQVRWELGDILQRLRITTIFVTHDIHEAFTLSDRLAVMEGGRIIQIGPSRDIYERPASPFVATFVGACNILRGTVLEAAGGTSSIALDAGGVVVALADQHAAAGEAADVYVRPERIALTPGTMASTGTTGRVKGRLRRATYLGSEVEYLVDLGGTVLRVKARAGPGAPVDVGDDVIVGWEAADAFARSSSAGPAPDPS